MNFKLNDIKNFLLEQGYPEWAGEIVERVSGQTRQAIKSDFDYSGRVSSTSLQFNFKGTDFVQDASITDFHFITYSYDSDVLGSGETQRVDKNFSKLWQSFLLKQYGRDYAKILFDWSIDHISNIQHERDEKIAKFADKENKIAKQKIEHFNESAKQAMSYLSDKEISDFAEDLNIY